MTKYKEIFLHCEEKTELDLDFPFYTEGSDQRNEVESSGVSGWAEVPSMSIKELEDVLDKMKSKGANRISIFSHTDHHGYYFYGSKLEDETGREVTNTEDELKLTEELVRSMDIEEVRRYKTDWDDLSVDYMVNDFCLTALVVCGNEVCKTIALEGVDGHVNLETVGDLKGFMAKSRYQILNDIKKEEPTFEVENWE